MGRSLGGKRLEHIQLLRKGGLNRDGDRPSQFSFLIEHDLFVLLNRRQQQFRAQPADRRSPQRQVAAVEPREIRDDRQPEP